MDKIVELLSNSEEMDIVIQNIASYVIYIYPGIISIYLYNFFVARKIKNTQAFIVKSFAISYLYNLLIQTLFFYICFLKDVPERNSIYYNAMLIFISFLLPYSCYRIKMSRTFTSICKRLGIFTSATDVPFELLCDSEEKYTCLKIYLTDQPYVYIGYLEEYEYEEGYEKYVILTGYRKYSISSKNNEKLIESHDSEHCNEKVFIKFCDIKCIEKVKESRAEKIYSKRK